MTHNWNWDDLRFALAVAEAGSVNAAAKRLGVNHATILRRVSAFEDAAGVVLFQRSARGYRVDPGAMAVMNALREVGGAVDRLGRVAAGEGERIAGPVQITSTDSLTLSVLPRLVARFREAYPAISVTLLSTNARLNLARLDAEVAIRPAPAAPEDMVSEQVGAMRMRVFASRDYLARRGDEATSWLGVSELLSRSPVFAWQGKLPPERIVFRADSFVTLAAMARAGMGLAMIPELLAGGLVRTPDDDELSVDIWVCAHHDLADSPRIALCRRWFAAALAVELGAAGGAQRMS